MLNFFKKSNRSVLTVATDTSRATHSISALPNINRELIANHYLTGHGIEIGALHNPLKVPSTALVQYLDRLSQQDLRIHYPELQAVNLVEVDIIDNGEELSTLDEASQDFVIANHFIEHCQNPIQALQNMLRVVKHNGILYLALPDKRYTFDQDREVTSLEHVLRDYREGPEWSRQQHFEEWARLVNKAPDEAQVAAQVQQLMALDYSIHYHVWTPSAILELILFIQQTLKFPFELELFLQHNDEMILILRKVALSLSA